MKIKYIGKSVLIEGRNERILAVGDLHLGYEESLRNGGYGVPLNLYKGLVDDFDLIFENCGRVDKIIILGDLKHEFGKILRDEWREVLDFIDYLKEKVKEIIVIKGNHDVILNSLIGKKSLRVVDFYVFEGLVFLHGDRDFKEIYDKKIKCWIMGHGHPAINLSDGTKKEKYKCFLEGNFKGKKIIITPSFFDLNVGSDPRDFDLGMFWNFDLINFNVKIVNELEVFDFGKLSEIKN